MAAPFLLPQFAARRIIAVSPIHESPHVHIFSGSIRDRPAAIKIMHLSQEADIDIMEREFSALQQLKHVNIVEMLDAFWSEDKGKFYLVIVTEQCDSDLGRDYKARKEANEPYPEAKLWEILMELASALSYMQGLEFAHRDIKPENVFLLAGHVKLGDLGSSKYCLPDISAPDTVIGTPVYLSPVLKLALMQNIEKVAHNVYKSDCYSLGITMFTLACLTLPFGFMSAKLTDENTKELVSKMKYSDEFKGVVWSMVRREECDRCDFTVLKTWLDRRLMATRDIVECMVCGVVKDRENLGGDTVVLDCDPRNHLFCSAKCFQMYLQGAEIPYLCPRCQIPIPEELHKRSKLEKIREKGALMIAGLKNWFQRGPDS